MERSRDFTWSTAGSLSVLIITIFLIAFTVSPRIPSAIAAEPLPLAGASVIPPDADASCDFETDPFGGPSWEWSGTWAWVKDASGNSFMLSPAGSRGLWKAEDFSIGTLGAQVRLDDTATVTMPRAKLLFDDDRDGTGRYVTIIAGSPGKIILGQKGVIGDTPGGTIKSVILPQIPTRKWLEVRIERTYTGISVFIPTLYPNKALLVRNNLPPRGGSAGFAAVSGRSRFDNFWFKNKPNRVIFGRVTDLEGNPKGGVLLNFTDAAYSTVTSDEGWYSSVVPYGWSGTVTPLGADTFVPPYRSYTPVYGDMPGQDYLNGPESLISGRVTDIAGNPREGVLLVFSDEAYNTVTDAGGWYGSVVPYAWTGTVAPSSDTDTFLPASRSYTLLGADMAGQDSKVEALRGCEGCHAGQVAAAPGVMDYWEAGGHGDPANKAPVPCAGALGCHDTSLPRPSTHGNGIVEGKGNPSANTYHLKSGFIVPGADPWDVQVNFGSYCTNVCHPAAIVPVMSHEVDGIPALDAVEFGAHLTVSDGETTSYPIDSDLSTDVSTAEPDYAPCVSCHDPHGTEFSKMLRDEYLVLGTLCLVCHQ